MSVVAIIPIIPVVPVTVTVIGLISGRYGSANKTTDDAGGHRIIG
jgi:hypothetical protein